MGNWLNNCSKTTIHHWLSQFSTTSCCSFQHQSFLSFIQLKQLCILEIEWVFVKLLSSAIKAFIETLFVFRLLLAIDFVFYKKLACQSIKLKQSSRHSDCNLTKTLTTSSVQSHQQSTTYSWCIVNEPMTRGLDMGLWINH